MAVADARPDIGLFAIDPVRGTQIACTDSYVRIGGSYLVRDASPLQDNDEADRAGWRVAAAQVLGNFVEKAKSGGFVADGMR